MKCNSCGKELGEGDAFCPFCGAKLSHQANTVQASPDPVTVQDGILHGKDGAYHWIYEVNLLKNPVILFTVWKIILLCAMAPGLLLFFLELGEGFVTALLLFGKIFAVVAVIGTVLTLVAYYLIIIPMYGGRYCVVFEMDDQGIRHTQMQKQFNRNRVLSMVGVLAGAVAGNPSVVGANLMSGAKQSTYSRFCAVRKITAQQKRHTIKIVTRDMEHNQIYADDRNFDFVLSFIQQHSPGKAMGKTQ